MKKIILLLFVCLSLQSFGQQPAPSKRVKHSYKFLFKGMEPKTISRKEFLAALNEPSLPFTFEIDSPASIKYEITKYYIVFRPLNPKSKVIEGNVRGTCDEIKSMMSPLRKDLSDIGSIVISDVVMMGPTGSVKISKGMTLEFME